jgi:hypothetical protein
VQGGTIDPPRPIAADANTLILLQLWGVGLTDQRYTFYFCQMRGMRWEGNARTWFTPRQKAELRERWTSGQCVTDITLSAAVSTQS